MREKIDSVISFLGELTDEDLARIFYEAMAKKNEYKRHPDGSFWNHLYVIGLVSHTEDSSPEIEILATAFDCDSPAVEAIKKYGANQSGECAVCGTFVVSTMKSAKCPICGSQVACS